MQILISRSFLPAALWLMVALFGHSCKTSFQHDEAALQVRFIDSTVSILNLKLDSLGHSEMLTEDSTLVYEDVSTLHCYQRIHPTSNKITLDERHHNGRYVAFYFIDRRPVLAVFSSARGYRVVEVGRQYFQQDSLAFAVHPDSIPPAAVTLRLADSVKNECIGRLPARSF